MLAFIHLMLGRDIPYKQWFQKNFLDTAFFKM